MNAPAQSSRDVISRLQQLIQNSLEPLHPGETPYALVDFPDHGNVGDSAIWLGEIELFCRCWKRRPKYICNYRDGDWRALDRAAPDGSIFIHGGGNFGDIWPAHQLFREEILQRFPGRPVIQLPQSVHYDSADAAKRTARVIAQHGNFTLCVRDEPSYEFARQHFECAIHLVPDMAFMLGPLPRPGPPSFDMLLLLRSDKEKVGCGAAAVELPSNIVVEDWLTDDPDLYRKSERHLLVQALVNPTLALPSTFQARTWVRYQYLAQARLRRGIKLLSQGRRIVTDRLHAHILATLLDIDHILLDNYYGKIERFADAWDTRWRGVGTATELSDAINQTRPE